MMKVRIALKWWIDRLIVRNPGAASRVLQQVASYSENKKTAACSVNVKRCAPDFGLGSWHHKGPHHSARLTAPFALQADTRQRRH